MIYKIKRFSFLDKLAGRKVLYHGTSEVGVKGIKESGLRFDWYKSKNNNTLGKLEKHKNGTLNPVMEKLMEFENPDAYKDLVYMTSDKKSADFMTKHNIRKGRGGETLEISLPYKFHRELTPVSNPEYQQAAHIHNSDDMSRYLFGKPKRELEKEDQKKLDSFIRAKNGDFIIRGKNILSKYIKGSKDYEPVTLKEIWDYQTRKFSDNRYEDFNLDPSRISPLKTIKYFKGFKKLPGISYTLVKRKWKNEDKYNEALLISISGKPEKGFFELVKDEIIPGINEDPNMYTCHFKTMSQKGLTAGTGSRYAKSPLTEEEKTRLFNAMFECIPVGAKLSTWGGISPGGIHAVNSLGERSGGRLIKIGTRKVTKGENHYPFIDIPVWEKIK